MRRRSRQLCCFRISMQATPDFISRYDLLSSSFSSVISSSASHQWSPKWSGSSRQNTPPNLFRPFGKYSALHHWSSLIVIPPKLFQRLPGTVRNCRATARGHELSVVRGIWADRKFNEIKTKFRVVVGRAEVTRSEVSGGFWFRRPWRQRGSVCGSDTQLVSDGVGDPPKGQVDPRPGDPGFLRHLVIPKLLTHATHHH